MNKLLDKVMVAHGSPSRWNDHQVVRAAALITGDLCGNGVSGTTRQITVYPHLARALVEPSGSPSCRSDLVANRLSIIREDGTVISEIEDVRTMPMNYDPKARTDKVFGAFPACCTVRTLLTTPFLLAMKGVEVNELVPWNEDGDRWRVLRAEFPPGFDTAARVHDFFFGGDFLLRRHDYHVDGDTGITITELVSDYVDNHGIRMPRKLRGYRRCSDLNPDLARVLISIDISTLEFSAT
ncbi:hypothetical protein CN090_33255 [Sinorhizobium meliloti]|uniref:hypothetical protein n=1 Tax=Rhizobium meliloti TaxID=382 RepID=UPI000376E307|nr:hypothetical protein [Sinorhizobium meliloti]MDE3788742.1 hypothetical protein [Sinorhizobium meliloti]MDE4597025.1 hypothetical protein [Sinorhizobium meliloti]QPI28187.1 hypothetical protein I0J99_18510 [Sinorhizobium meliloti]RMI06348.1 hypothetical protein DA101_028940 [Sinorhizobium meliloti]RVG01401.1 hypothetical protein CN234_31310 [Sinorhizobium meliloti]